ncbi:MAG: phosphate regulon transcriptional regulator PhoB [Thiotrichaceae bacterium]|nr:phosphate regulon transcriptional regulator PhoB [Thiotrichaceae bacterium]
MNKKIILIVEDEKPIRDMVRFSFFNSHFTLEEAENVQQAREKIVSNPPDLILLDWMLPGTDGVSFARELRANPDTRQLPIIMLTAKSEEKDKVQGLSAGMDDYVVKPFSTKELIARINAVLRRFEVQEEDITWFAELSINKDSHRVTCRGKNVPLGPLEYKLLAHFMKHPDKVYSRSRLLDKVWGGDTYVEERTVDVHIRRLRKILQPFAQDNLIQTIRGSGYRFSLEE